MRKRDFMPKRDFSTGGYDDYTLTLGVLFGFNRFDRFRCRKLFGRRVGVRRSSPSYAARFRNRTGKQH